MITIITFECSYSGEAYAFTYGGVDPNFDIGVVQKLQAEGETERRGRIWWEMGNFDAYRVNYRKTGEGYEWFTVNVTTDELNQAGAKKEGNLKIISSCPLR